jgi:hypothetical protein
MAVLLHQRRVAEFPLRSLQSLFMRESLGQEIFDFLVYVLPNRRRKIVVTPKAVAVTVSKQPIHRGNLRPRRR